MNNSISSSTCRFPAAGDLCESDFLTEYSFFMLPLLCILILLQSYNAASFLYIAWKDLLLLKSSAKEIPWSRLKQRYKFLCALNFAGSAIAGPLNLIGTTSLCPICLGLLKISFPLSGVFAHEAIFFLTLFFFQAQGILTKGINNLISIMRVATVIAMSISPITSFSLQFDTVLAMRINMFFAGVAFLLNFSLVEYYRKDIIENVAKIKERAMLAATCKSGGLPPTNHAMILEEKVHFFLSESRKHLPPNVVISVALGASPVLEAFYVAPILISIPFGFGVAVSFLAFSSMLKKSKSKSVSPLATTLRTKLLSSKTTLNSER